MGRDVRSKILKPFSDFESKLYPGLTLDIVHGATGISGLINSIYFYKLLNKIVRNNGLYFCEILSAFRIYTILKAVIPNKVCRLV